MTEEIEIQEEMKTCRWCENYVVPEKLDNLICHECLKAKSWKAIWFRGGQGCRRVWFIFSEYSPPPLSSL